MSVSTYLWVSMQPSNITHVKMELESGPEQSLTQSVLSAGWHKSFPSAADLRVSRSTRPLPGDGWPRPVSGRSRQWKLVSFSFLAFSLFQFRSLFPWIGEGSVYLKPLAKCISICQIKHSLVPKSRCENCKFATPSYQLTNKTKITCLMLPYTLFRALTLRISFTLCTK